jgi:hypothetical protein
MRRVSSVLLTAVLPWVPLAAPVSANEGCTEGNVKGFANGTIAVAKQSQPGRQENGTAGAWSNCQFRFYDDTTTHVFTDEEYFLGGIFIWITDDEIEEFGLTRKEAVSDLDSIQDRLFWRAVGEAWTELPITKSTVRGVNAPLFGDVFHVMDHRYHIFAPGSEAPGMYQWKWQQTSPFFPPGEVTGEVLIVDA